MDRARAQRLTRRPAFVKIATPLWTVPLVVHTWSRHGWIAGLVATMTFGTLLLTTLSPRMGKLLARPAPAEAYLSPLFFAGMMFVLLVDFGSESTGEGLSMAVASGFLLSLVNLRHRRKRS